MVESFHARLHHYQILMELTYNNFFAQLLKLFRKRNGASPTDILVDFERTAINALSNLQPQLEIKGCFYQFCANIWRNIQSLGLQMLS